jgi:catechol 2,3-dioxygenase-like lactoylglutathione lyase family enzyme
VFWRHGAASFDPKFPIQTMKNDADKITSHVENINAITLVTTDMAVSVRFYQALGMRIRYGGESAEFTSLYAGTCFVNLVLNQSDEKPVFWGRVIFHVDNVDAVYQQIRAAGYQTETQPADASWGERYFHIRDPDNHQLSFALLLT